MPALAEAIDRLIEANAALRKRRALAPLERDLLRATRSAFRQQRRAFLARLAPLAPYFPPAVREAASPVPWEPAFDEAALATIRAFAAPIDAAAARALAAGARAAVADLALTTAFDLAHPAAVAFLARHGAETAIGVNQTTRGVLRTLLAQAADEGWGYDRTAREIAARYRRFAGPPSRRYLHVRSRAHAIAIYEVGNAYEHGNMLVARDLADAGLAMEKQWLSVGDRRVRPDHRANQDQGWLPLDSTFQDGSDRPPTDAGCRCTLLMRRKPGA